MAFGFHHDAVQWLAADGVATEYTIGSLGFTPKAVMAWCMGLQSSTDAASNSVDARVAIGFAESGGTRRSATIYSQDTADPSNCGAGARNDCIVAVCDGAAAFTGMLDIAFDSDGIRLIVDDATPANLTVFVMIWGGDITPVVGDIAEPAATGNVDYTATGMVAGASDQVLLLAGCQSTAALNTAAATDAGIFFGAAHNSSEQHVSAANDDDASATMDTDHYNVSGECLAQIVLGGGSPNARAAFVQWNTDGFRLNWLARATTNRRSIFMAIKGGQWAVGELTIDVQTVNNTATVSGLAFQPLGICVVTGSGAEETAGSSGVLAALSIGCGTSPSDRRWQGYRSNNSAAACEIQNAVRYESVVGMLNNSAATRTRQDIDAINSDGFRLIVDQANAADVTNWWDGYIAFAAASIEISADLATLVLSAAADATIALDFAVPVDLGALSLSPQTSTVALDQAIAAAVASLTLAAQDAVVIQDVTVPVTLGALALAPQAAAVDLVQLVAVQLGSLTLALQPSQVLLDVSIAAQPGALALATLPGTVLLSQDVVAQAAALVLGAQQAGVSIGSLIQAVTAALSLSPQAATVLFDIAIAVEAGSLSLAGQQAAVTLETAIAAALAALSLSANPADVALAAQITAALGSLTLEALEAVVEGGAAVVIELPEEQVLVLSARAPFLTVASTRARGELVLAPAPDAVRIGPG